MSKYIYTFHHHVPPSRQDPIAALCWPGTTNNNGGMRKSCLGLSLECDLNQLLRETRPEVHEQWQADCAKRHGGGEIGGMVAADDTAWDFVPALMDMACYGDDDDDHSEAYHAAQDDNDGNQDMNALDWEEENVNHHNHQQGNHLKRSRKGQENDDEDQGDFIEQQQAIEEQDDGSVVAKKSKRMSSVYDGSNNVVLIGADIPTLPPSLLTVTASASVPTRILPMSRIQQLLRAAMNSPPNHSSLRLDTIVKTAAALQKPASHRYARRVFLSLVFLADSHNKKGEVHQMHLDEVSSEQKVVAVSFYPKKSV